MKKNIKCLRASLAAVLALSMLAGCSGNGGTSSTASTGNSSTPASSASSSSASASAEPSSLKVEVFDRAVQGGSDPTNNYWTKWIAGQMKEQHNIDVSFVSVPRSEEIPQLNVLMASGNAPDIVFSYNQSVAYNYYRQGGLADLTDVVAQHGSNIQSYLGDDILSYGKFDDRLYMIPAKRIARGTYVTYMRKDWLDILGLPVPKTKQEFYEALVAFKEKNPGKVEKVIPFGVTSGMPSSAGSIIDSFIDPKMSEEDAFVKGVSANDIGTALLYPGFKDGIQFLNKLYNEGLIDPQFPLYKDNSPLDDLISRGSVGAFDLNYDYPMRTSPGVYNNLKKNVPTAELIPVDCFENSEGKNVKQMYIPTGIYSFVPASSKNVEGAVKYFDFLCKNQYFITTGEKDINHTLDENGYPVMINLKNDERMMNSPNNLDYALVVNGVDMGDESKNVDVLSKSYEAGYEDIFKQAYDISMKDAKVFCELIVPFDSEAQFSASLNDKRKEILSAAITASEDQFSSVYDNGINEWLTAGGQQCLDERQAYWDANKK